MKLKWIILFCSLSLISMAAKTKKAVFIIVDGIPADMIERLNTPAIDEIASKGAYARAYTGGEIGSYSQTPTISAIGYTNLLTATWMNKHNVDGNSNLSLITIIGRFSGLPKSNLNRIKRQFIQAGQITGQSCWEKESRKLII